MPLNVYGGMCDHEGEPARFLFDNNIRAFRKDYGAVKEGMRILLEARTGMALSYPKCPRRCS